MNTAQKLLSMAKIALLVGLCLYTVLSSLLFIYLQIHFFDPIYFPRVMIQILAVNTVFLLNLFLSARQFLLPEKNTVHSAGDRAAVLVCSVIGFVMFLRLALHSGAVYDYFFLFCNLVIVGLSAYDFLPHK